MRAEQRRADPGPQALPRPGTGLAADRRPQLLRLPGLEHRRAPAARSCCGGCRRRCRCRCSRPTLTAPTPRCWSTRRSAARRTDPAGRGRRVGAALDPDRAVEVRVVEYTVPDREGNGTGELIALVTTITDPRDASAEQLAQAYHQRWEHETGNKQLKTHLRGPGKILRSKKPGHGSPGDLRLPADPLRDQRPDLPGRDRGRHRPRPGQVPAHRSHRPPGRRACGLPP